MLELGRGSHTISKFASHRLADREDGERSRGGDLAGQRVRLGPQLLIGDEAIAEAERICLLPLHPPTGVEQLEGRLRPRPPRGG